MTCPDMATWRAWLDDEAAAGMGEHLTGCAACAQVVDELRADAGYAAAAIASLDPSPVAAAPPAPAAAVVIPIRRSRRPFAAAAAVVLIAVALVGTPGGRTATADFLSVFRGEKFSLVELTSNDATNAMFALSRLGTVDAQDGYMSPEPVRNVAEAERRTGIDVRVPTTGVPDGLSEVMVTEEQELRFTFDARRTNRYLDEEGAKDVSLPAGFDGAQLVVRVPAGVLQVFRAADGLPRLAVGQAGVVTVDVIGEIELETLRAFLLDLPGLPDSVVRQVGAMDDWRNTLPIPIPIDQLDAEETTVDGAEAIVVNQAGFGSGLLWQRDGLVTGVAGPLDEDELRAVAAGLTATP